MQFSLLYPTAILCLIQILVVLITLVVHTRKSSKPVSPLPPGPSTWPILGCFLEMLRNGPVYLWVQRIMEELHTDIACFRLGRTHVITVSSPEIAREFLKKHDAVFSSRPASMATRIVSNGYMTTAFGPLRLQWKKMRKVLVSNVFSHASLGWLLDKRNQEADYLVRVIYNQCSNTLNGAGAVVDVRTAALQYTTGVMKRLVFNIRHFGKAKDDGGPCFEEQDHAAALFTLLFHTYAFSVSDYFPWLEWLDLDGHRRKIRDAMEVVSRYQDPIIDDRIRMWRDGTRTVPEDILDIFVSLTDSNGKPLLCRDEIRAQITELFMAGVDNPYNAAEWALSEMLNQPHMIEKAVLELDSVVGKGRLLQESDIPRLPYVVACAREALRLHPVAPFNLPHTSTADCTVAGYFIPKGSSVLLSRLGLGRNPKVWDDPLQFDPNRHLQDGHVDLAEAQLRFVSFTTGRRGCAGGKLGTNMTVMLLGRILHGFEWSIPDGLDRIDLSQHGSLLKAKPLFAHAKPRLNASVYLSLSDSSV